MKCPNCQKDGIHWFARFKLALKIYPKCTHCQIQLIPEPESKLMATIAFFVLFVISVIVFGVTGSFPLGIAFLCLAQAPYSLVRLMPKTISRS